MNTRKTAFQNRDSTVMDVGSDSETPLWSLDMLATDRRSDTPFILSSLVCILGCLLVTKHLVLIGVLNRLMKFYTAFILWAG